MNYRNKALLKSHIKKMHSVSYTCEHCGKVCKNQQKYRLHVLALHTADEDKPFRCAVCGKGFVAGQMLRTHMNIHMNLKPHKCQVCSAAFNDLSNRNQHMKKCKAKLAVGPSQRLDGGGARMDAVANRLEAGGIELVTVRRVDTQ